MAFYFGKGEPLPSFPLTLPNLVAWYSADQGAYADAGVTLATNGQEVQQWNDLSGNGYHLSRDGTGPNLNTTGLNGRPALMWTSTQQLKRLAVATGGSNKVSMYAVAALASGGDAYSRIFSFTATESTLDYNDNYSILLCKDSGNQALLLHKTSAVCTASLTYGVNYRMGAVVDGTNGTIYLNNSQVGQGGANNLDLGGPNNDTCTLRIGCSTQVDEQWYGPISEVVITTNSLDSTQRDALDSYFVSKWGF